MKLKKIKTTTALLITCLTILSLPQTASAQSLWDSRASFLFTDQKGHNIGDSITIIISEASSAYQNANTKLDNKNSFSVGPGTGMLGTAPLDVANGLSQKDNFQGTGETKRSGMLSATITARIMKILENGEYKIRGEKEIVINTEKQTILLTGVIRSQDISETNEVYSRNIANAKIEYIGSGPIGDSQEPGLLSKVFAWIF